MNESRHFTAVAFDMDGLMFDTERIGLEAFEHAARSLGYEAPEGFFTTLIGKNVADADRLMREAFGASFPIPAVRAAREHFIASVRHARGIPAKPGLQELLDDLSERAVVLCVASSSPRVVIEENLSREGIRDRFDVIVSGDEVAHGKPHPEIYAHVAAAVGRPPQECIAIEDSLIGIESAYAAGMVPIMVPDLQSPTNRARRIARRIFPSLHEVRTYLRELPATDTVDGV